eukprot:m.81286 g.81286  ORF g.81286 m.81286 type:complete len:689 (-) comp14869_c1_seq2:401-2467(-)
MDCEALGAAAVLTSHNGRLLSWDAQSSALKVADATGALQIVQPTPAITWAVKHISVNESGTHLLLTGDDNVTVIRLPTPRQGGKGGNTVTTQAVGVGEFFTSVGVCEAKWHSLSSSHIAVLLHDGSLSLFSVEQPDKPETTVAVAEEVLNLSAASASGQKVVSFAFGPKHLWETFTVYVLLESGDVVSVCPLVPNGCERPRALIEQLMCEATDDRVKNWLLQASKDSFRNRPASTTVTLINPSSTSFPLKKQGPFYILPSSNDNYGCCSVHLAVTQTIPVAFLTVEEDGHVFIGLSLSLSQPAWAAPEDSGEDEESDDRRLELHMVEQLDCSEFKFAPGTVSFLTDDSNPERLFLQHANGVYMIRLRWLQSHSAFCSAVGSSAKSGKLRDVSEAATIVSCLFRANSDSGKQTVFSAARVDKHLYVALGADGLVRLDAEMLRPLAPLRDTAAYFAERADRYSSVKALKDEPDLRTPVADVVDSLLAGATTPLLSLKDGRDGQLPAEAVAEEIFNNLKSLRDKEMAAIGAAREEIRHRTQILERCCESQTKELSVVRQMQTDAKTRGAALDTEIKAVADKMANLKERLEIVMSGLVASMPTLSIAEEEYQQQVQHHSENTKRYVQKLKELELKWARLKSMMHRENFSRPRKQHEKISQRQQDEFCQALGNQHQRIDSLMKNMQRLQLHAA